MKEWLTLGLLGATALVSVMNWIMGREHSGLVDASNAALKLEVANGRIEHEKLRLELMQSYSSDREEVKTGLASCTLALEHLRSDLLMTLAKDKEETRQWVNGSFMRAGMVSAELLLLKERLNRMESTRS